jgi:hypothetical protein
MPTGGHHDQQHTLTPWLVELVIHGIGAGVVTGALLLASESGLADLISMQSHVGLALGLYFYVCAQIGACAALLIGCCMAGEV